MAGKKTRFPIYMILAASDNICLHQPRSKKFLIENSRETLHL
ncbi:hypothetical protein BN1221_00361c [Brenneria goodwinii]|uniref:Uncharacterized protein n=1 Tax=Brenneria goodwinii TaxID=1109412 RepID=A0A0G4JPU6_9GAMM|nr:hypothetical protein BN1221_00361c [Brenneria goodwinii]